MYLENPSYQQRHRAQRSHPSQKYIFYFFFAAKNCSCHTKNANEKTKQSFVSYFPKDIL